MDQSSSSVAQPAAVQTPCAEGRHYACGFKNCSCTCHTKPKPKSKAKAIFIGIAVWVAIGTIIAVFVSSKAGSDTPAVKMADAPKAYKLTDTVKVGYWTYVVGGSKWSSAIGPEGLRERADAKFLIVALAAQNDDKTASVLPPIKLVDAQGREFQESEKGFLLEHAFGPMKQLNPGVQSTGLVVFDVPEGKYWMVVSGGFGSTETAKIEL